MTRFSFASTSPLGIGFEELEGSPKVSYTRGTGITGTRMFRCNWDDYSLLAQELLGTITYVAGAPVSATPMSFPGVEFLIVQSIDVEPFMPNSPDGTNIVSLAATAQTYRNTGAKLTVKYGPMDVNNDQNRPDIPNGTYLTVRADYGADYVTVPGRYWVWDGGANDGNQLPDDVNAGFRIPTVEYVFTWSLVTDPPSNTITSAIGKVNSSSFYGQSAQTLLFTGVNVSRQFQFGPDEGVYQVEYKFSAKNRSWNQFFSEKDGAWNKIKTAVGGTPPYPTTNFDTLFGYNG